MIDKIMEWSMMYLTCLAAVLCVGFIVVLTAFPFIVIYEVLR